MRITHARVTIYSIDLTRKETCDLIVDTDSTFSWVPEEIAQRLGIRPAEIRIFRLADGTETDRPIGDAIVECQGLRGATRIVFAQPGDGCLMGLHALEGLGLEVDPVTRTLHKVDAFLALVAT